MKKSLLRFKAMLLAGAVALSGATLSGCSPKKYDGNEMVMEESDHTYDADILPIGKHIISVPIKNPVDYIMQYNYHPGYKVVGIASSSARISFYRACLVYVNEYPVECHCTRTDEKGNRIYENFGQPIGYVRNETEKGEFNPGEHIISIPVNDLHDSIVQYDYHEGYEVVGIASSFLEVSPDGACLLYVNTSPVKCPLTKEEDGKEYYLSFGTPIEKEKTLR